MSNEPKIIFVHESVLASAAKDAVTVALLVAATLLGWWVGSAALQWLGGMMALVSVMMAAVVRSIENARRTPQEAADWLLREFGVKARRENEE